MKIFGIGTDIVNIKRMDHSLKKHGSSFKNKIFSKKEIYYCERKDDPTAFYAKRFAAKEAFGKALGTGIRKGVNFKNIEISNNVHGKPFIFLKGSLANLVKKKLKNKKYDIHLSLSDDKPWAHATVIIAYNK
jgi:holo-[acyl-carrier protein] synthase|tara:strand:- start:242 stop:637 length:396 start_codon:yes stop_codon:yes gene_type:complete